MPARLFPSTAPPIRLALGSLAVYAGTRAVAYAVPGRDVQDPLIAASFGGRLLPLYVALWAVAALLCLWDMRRPTITGWGPRAVVGMMALWGTAYGVAWVVAPGLANTGHGKRRDERIEAPALQAASIGLHLDDTRPLDQAPPRALW